MIARKSIGRPSKVDVKTIMMLADMLQHSASVSDACRYAGISRDTYYRYMNNEPIFAEKMNAARTNQNKLAFTFLTTPR